MRRVSERPHWQNSLLTGILIGLSYPPTHLGFFAVIGFIPLFHVILNSTPCSAAKWAYLASVTANLISLYWIGLNSGAAFWIVLLSMIAAVLYLGLFWAGFGWITAFVHQRTGKGLVAATFFWVAMEFIRSFGTLGFPWINLALTQSTYLPVIQMLEVTGTYGISFWIILVNAALYGFLFPPTREKVSAVLPILIFLLPWVLGGIRLWTLKPPEGKSFSVAIVQPNVNPLEKWDRSKKTELFALMDSLHTQANALKPDLVLWPEAALPAYLRLNTTARKPIMEKIRSSGIPLLTGTPDQIRKENESTRYYNSTILLKPDGTLTMYAKLKLVPFGEYVPFSNWLTFLDKMNFGQGNFEQGKEFTVFEVNSVKFSNMICYDSSFPSLAREFIRSGARFLTIQSNDGWWGVSSGPFQHFELARLRAVENRVPVVRSANTGISGYFLPSGKTLGKLSFNSAGIQLAEVTLSDRVSFYSRFGDVFAWMMVLLSIGFIGLGWASGKQ